MAVTVWYKILLPMKRRSGMSVEDFRAYYEDHHIPLCLKHPGRMKRHIRRYLNPQPLGETGPCDELPFDVITELWFDDEAAFTGTLAYLSRTIMPDEIVADENNLFDRSAMRIATETVCETDPG